MKNGQGSPTPRVGKKICLRSHGPSCAFVFDLTALCKLISQRSYQAYQVISGDMMRESRSSRVIAILMMKTAGVVRESLDVRTGHGPSDPKHIFSKCSPRTRNLPDRTPGPASWEWLTGRLTRYARYDVCYIN